jgi:aryl-alcohol dehydrogenase-like predicted oxidoreductase
VLGSYFGKDKKNSTIITKFSVMNHDNPLSKIEAEKKIVDQVENSLSSLGYNSLPLLLMHNEYDLDVYGQTVVDTLKRLKRDGLVERVGISLNHFDYVDKVLENDMFEAVQLPLNMLDVKNATGNAIKRLKERNLLVFIRSVFLQGLFFRDPETLPDGVLQNAKEPLKMVRKIAEEENMSIAGLAISYIRDLDGVSSLVMGADNREQVKENINLINVKKISDNSREKIVKAFKNVDERVLCPWLWNK